jgi:hypothetical protein
VGGHDDGSMRCHFCEEVAHHELAIGGVEEVEWFIEAEELRLEEDDAEEFDKASLAVGHLVRIAVDERRNAFVEGMFLDFFLADVDYLLDILHAGHPRKKSIFLEDEGLFSQGNEFGLAACRGEVASEQLQKGGFATTGRAFDDGEWSRNSDTEILKYRLFPVGKVESFDLCHDEFMLAIKGRVCYRDLMVKKDKKIIQNTTVAIIDKLVDQFDATFNHGVPALSLAWAH